MRPRMFVVAVPVVALLATVWLPFVNRSTLWFGLPSVMVWTVGWVLAITPALALLEFSPEQREAYDAGLREIDSSWPPATVANLVDHIDHAVKLIGIDHVGISSDFDGGGGIAGWNDAAETANVTAELEKRGYSREDIGKIWSGNLLRVWREVEQKAAELKTGR